MEYSKPFLITYINTATFSFYLIPLLFKRIKSKYQQYSTAEERYSLLDNTNKKVKFKKISLIISISDILLQLLANQLRCCK